LLTFAHGFASRRKHFRTPPSRSRSAAATRASRALQKRWDRPRAGLDLILDQRAAEMADVPGGASGLLCRDYKGKEATGW
jgi:hypothetical protein